MLVDGSFIESVDLCGLGGSDVVGDNFDGRQAAPREKKLGPFSREGAGDAPPIAPPAP